MGIPETIERVLADTVVGAPATIADVLHMDADAREAARGIVAGDAAAAA